LFSFFWGLRLHFVLLCRLWLIGNPSLPYELQQNALGQKRCQDVLRRIVEHFEFSRRAATVLIGLKKFKRAQIFEQNVPMDLIKLIARMVCKSHRDTALDRARSALKRAK
jgi:hypothetical protein